LGYSYKKEEKKEKNSDCKFLAKGEKFMVKELEIFELIY